jgi:hypothetical protein
MVAQQAGVHSMKDEGSSNQIYLGSGQISQFGVRAHGLPFNYSKCLKDKHFFNKLPESRALTPKFG